MFRHEPLQPCVETKLAYATGASSKSRAAGRESWDLNRDTSSSSASASVGDQREKVAHLLTADYKSTLSKPTLLEWCLVLPS